MNTAELGESYEAVLRDPWDELDERLREHAGELAGSPVDDVVGWLELLTDEAIVERHGDWIAAAFEVEADKVPELVAGKRDEAESIIRYRAEHPYDPAAELARIEALLDEFKRHAPPAARSATTAKPTPARSTAVVSSRGRSRAPRGRRTVASRSSSSGDSDSDPSDPPRRRRRGAGAAA